MNTIHPGPGAVRPAAPPRGGDRPPGGGRRFAQAFFRGLSAGAVVFLLAARPASAAAADGAVGASAGAPASAAGPEADRSAAPSAGPRRAEPAGSARRAVAALSIVSRSDEAQSEVPFTVGHFFAPGDFPKGKALEGLQVDEVAAHPADSGSVGFAVISGHLPRLAARERRSLPIRVVDRADAAPPRPAADQPLDTYAEIRFFQPQKTGVYFSNRNGNAVPGVEFVEGEELTVTLTDRLGSEAVTYRVPKEFSGPGSFPKANSIARQVEELIRRGTRRFTAEPGFEERSQISTRDPAGGAFRVAVSQARKAPIAVYPIQAFAEPRTYRATPVLDRARLRLDGPYAREYDLPTPFVNAADGQPHGVLQARFLVRFLPGGRARYDLVFENNATFAEGAGNQFYAAEWFLGGERVLRQDAFKHFHHGSWSRRRWTGGKEPRVYVRQDMQYMQDSGLMYNFDQNLQVAEKDKVAAAAAARAAEGAADPMHNAGMQYAMPGTGGREDIGAQPMWVARAQVDPDERLDDRMLAIADTAMTVPMQYRDEKTDQPVDLVRHWGLDLQPGFARDGMKLPAMADGTTPWQPDADHQPAASFYAYVRTGDARYLRTMQYWANWNILSIHPDIRGRRAVSAGGQVRGMAWNLRGLGEVNWVTPDRHPMKRYFRERLQVNLQEYVDRWVRGDMRAPLHNMEGPKAALGYTRPWMNDFLAFPVSQMARLGIPNAREFADYLVVFVADRWLNPRNRNFATRQMGTAYNFDTWDYRGRVFQTWDEVIAYMFPQHDPLRPETWAQFKDDPRPGRGGEKFGTIPVTETWVGGYTGVASGANGAMADLYPQSRKVFEMIEKEIAPGFQREFNDNPSYAIVPRGYVRKPYAAPAALREAAPATAARPIALRGAASVAENGSFTLAEAAAVRYGAGGRTIERTLEPGTWACSNATFTDPAVGLVKACALAGSAVPAAGRAR
ncbi:MAG: hypothetical protein PGN26_08915 [Xylophilus ampelinus]